jgi:multidrug efflux pump
LRETRDRVELGVEDERSVARYNGRPSVGVGHRQAVGGQRARRGRAGEGGGGEDPAGACAGDVQVAVAFDSSVFVRRAVTEVQETILVAFVLVLLIMLAFLRNLRSTLIPMIAVPVSLVGTFLVLNLSWATASTF